jgi:tellurium resistance protein TerZ
VCGGAVTHSGDNRTGDGDGDDEWVRINVDKLPSEVSVIMFVVNAYSGGSF